MQSAETAAHKSDGWVTVVAHAATIGYALTHLTLASMLVPTVPGLPSVLVILTCLPLMTYLQGNSMRLATRRARNGFTAVFTVASLIALTLPTWMSASYGAMSWHNASLMSAVGLAGSLGLHHVLMRKKT